MFDFKEFASDEFDSIPAEKVKVAELTSDTANLSDDEMELIRNAMIDGDYDDVDALRFSTLSRFASSDWFFREVSSDNYPETAQMAFGTAFHCYLLEPEKFQKTYAMFEPPVNPKTGKPFGSTTNAYADALEEFRKSGKIPLTESDAETIQTMFRSFVDHGFEYLIENGMAEVPLLVTGEDGNDRKCKIDFLSREYGIIDVKTTGRSLSNIHGEDSFRWELRANGYPEQLTFYQNLVESIIGRVIPACLLVFETKRPFRVARYRLSATAHQRCLAHISTWEDSYFSPESNYEKLDWVIE